MHVERLTGRHRLDGFDSGTKDLDHWLVRHAVENQRRDLSRTFVLVDDGDEVVGYYSLTMGGVRKDELPSPYGRGLPGYGIGMVLLARLAISVPHQGCGLGRDLLVDALAHAAAAGRHAAARFIAVDPIDDRAMRFYRAFGFRNVPGDEGGRMYLRVDHALQAFDDHRP